jgi:hypothetical protein
MAVHKGGNIDFLPVFDDEIILGWKSFAIDPEKNGESQVFCIFGDYELVQEEFTAMGFSKSNPMAIGKILEDTIYSWTKHHHAVFERMARGWFVCT